MKGYAFLSSEGNIEVRTQEFIDNDSPNFWALNQDFILKAWKFDTDNLDSVKTIIIYLRDIASKIVNKEKIDIFLGQIGVSLSDLISRQ